jgi:hypothetical protein
LVGGVLDGAPLLDTGEALLLGDAILLAARIKLKFPAIEPLSQARNFWQEWGARARIRQQLSPRSKHRQSRTVDKDS